MESLGNGELFCERLHCVFLCIWRVSFCCFSASCGEFAKGVVGFFFDLSNLGGSASLALLWLNNSR